MSKGTILQLAPSLHMCGEKKGACIRAQRQINKLEKGKVHIDSCRWSVFQHHSKSLRDTQHVLVTPAAQVDQNDLVFR